MTPEELKTAEELKVKRITIEQRMDYLKAEKAKLDVELEAEEKKLADLLNDSEPEAGIPKARVEPPEDVPLPYEPMPLNSVDRAASM